MLKQACEAESPLAGPDSSFAGQKLAAAVGRHRQAVGQTNLVVLFLLAHTVFRHAQIPRNVLARDLDRLLFAIGDDLASDFARDARDLSLERAHARLLRVVVHDRANRVLRNGELYVIET